MSLTLTRFFFGVLMSCVMPLAVMADEPADPAKVAARVKTAIEKLDALAEETLESTGVPGIAIAVVHKGKVAFTKGYGVREAGKPEPIDADTVFQVASVSKPISSTVMAALVGEGGIEWDDRVIDHDVGFVMYHPYVTREVRLRDFLCHRSGLPDHGGDLLEDIGYDRAEILRRLRYLPPSSSFRTAYAYTNYGYSEACYAAATTRSESWDELADQKLFQPLGMKATSYRFADYAKASNRALLHVKVGGKWRAKHTRQPDAQAPAGGVSSTLNDLTRWMRLQLDEGQFEGKHLITSEALAETHKPQIVLDFVPSTGRVAGYGLGWNVSVERGDRMFLRHSGAFSLGMRSEVALIPSEEIGIAVLSNAAPTGVPEGLTESFFDWVLDGELQRDWVEFANRMFEEEENRELGEQPAYSQPPKNPTPPLAHSAYSGKYSNDFFGSIEFVDKKGKLALRIGPKLMALDLSHWDRDIFTYQPVGEMAGKLSGVRFSVAADRKADRVLIENLNVHGLGTFSRTK